jgi:hypothetical protein
LVFGWGGGRIPALRFGLLFGLRGLLWGGIPFRTAKTGEIPFDSCVKSVE